VRSAERLAEAMRSGGNRNVSVRVFPGISHAFLPDPIGLNSGWAALPGFMTRPQGLQTLTDWIGTPPADARAALRASRSRPPWRVQRALDLAHPQLTTRELLAVLLGEVHERRRCDDPPRRVPLAERRDRRLEQRLIGATVHRHTPTSSTPFRPRQSAMLFRAR